MEIEQQLVESIKNDDEDKFARLYLKINGKHNLKWIFEQIYNDENGLALCMKGLMFEYGNYVLENIEKAYQHYVKSAEKKCILALSCIGELYEYGEYVKRDIKKAYEYYSRGAEKECAWSLYDLGRMYYDGRYVKQNYAKAYQYFMKSAKKDYGFAFDDLGNMYYYGRYVERDFEKSFQYYMKSIECGYIGALDNLQKMQKMIDYIRKDDEKMIDYIRKDDEKMMKYCVVLHENDRLGLIRSSQLFELLEKLYKENQELKERNMELQTEIECIPEYGEAYKIAKDRFEKLQGTEKTE